MSLTKHSVFKNENDNTEEDNLRYFLEKFPSEEVWRFFIERSRYHVAPALMDQLSTYLSSNLIDYGQGNVLLSKEQALLFLEQATIGKLFEIASKLEKGNVLLEELNDFCPKADPNLSFKDYITKIKAWKNFEATEPGYLEGVVEGLVFILKNVQDPDHLTLNYIKKLHETCTEHVAEYMRKGTVPGQFRGKWEDAKWGFTLTGDSKEGLKEILEYMKKDETFGITIFSEGTSFCDCTDKTFNVDQMTNRIWQEIQKKGSVSIATAENKLHGSKFNTPQYLDQTFEKHLTTYKASISHAKNKEEKLRAIFTFLKFTVLHHSFLDGVGRAMSMLLIQDLMLSNKLLPALLYDSNVIPGLSVNEMIQHYLNAEKELKKICEDPSFASSEAFVKNNINTEEFMDSLTNVEKRYYDKIIDNFALAKEELLEQINQKSSDLNLFQ